MENDFEELVTASEHTQSEDSLSDNYFERLPEHILEEILSKLPDRELSNLSSLNSRFFRLCNKIIRKNFFKLFEQVNNELEILTKEIDSYSLNHTGLMLRIYNFRSHVALEFLRSEMVMMRAFGRGFLYSEDKAILFSRVLSDYEELYHKARLRNLGRLKVNDDLINNIIHPSKLMISKIKNHKLTKKIPLGTRLLDLLDCLINKEYNVAVKFCFHQTFEFVVVDGIYQFNPMNLYSPPTLLRINNDEHENTVAHPDDNFISSLIDYLFSVIRLNNKSYLKEASYEREEEFNNRRQAVAVLQHGLGVPLPGPIRWLNQQPTSYSKKKLILKKCFHRDEESFWVKHRYRSPGFSGHLSMNRKEFKCRVCITCDIKDSPIFAQEVWSEIKKESLNPEMNISSDIRNRIEAIDLKKSIFFEDVNNTETELSDAPPDSSMEAKLEVVLNSSDFVTANPIYELYTLNIYD